MIRVRITSMAVGLLAAGIASGAAAEHSAETVFREARTYTVRVRTQIETPFINDAAGAFEGAGFLVDAQRGWIVTNAHVVGQSPSTVRVAFAGGAYEPARKLYVDSFADIAVLSLDRTVIDRRAARLDRTTPPVIGETVGAFGHPLGVPFTGTRGIVSGIDDQDGPNLIQIDATIDHGNSGGPVISFRDGCVLGIATSGAGRDQRDRLNFATPITSVRRILALLRDGRSPCPPIMGFALFKDEDGRHTMEVARTFDANAWPFEPGDRIVGIQGHAGSIERYDDLVGALRGSTGAVAMKIERGGRMMDMTVHPTLRPAITERRGISIDGALIGPLGFEDDPQGVVSSGLIVHSIEPSSTAQSIDLERLDMVHRVDGQAFDSLDSLIAHVRSHKGQPVRIEVRRFTEETYRIFEYHTRELPGTDVKLVGPPEKSPVASR